jgi:hypothetical protein
MDNLVCSVDGNLMDFIVLDIYDINDNETWFGILDEVFSAHDIDDLYLMHLYSFMLFNTTFESFSNTTIDYSYAYNTTRGPVEMLTGGCDRNLLPLSIRYFIGTGKLWNHNITETVKMSVTGKQPTSYGSYNPRTGSSKECVIVTKDDTTNYTWFWDNEEINEISAGISYSREELNCLAPDILFDIILWIILSAIIARIRRRQKNCKIDNILSCS